MLIAYDIILSLHEMFGGKGRLAKHVALNYYEC